MPVDPHCASISDGVRDRSEAWIRARSDALAEGIDAVIVRLRLGREMRRRVFGRGGWWSIGQILSVLLVSRAIKQSLFFASCANAQAVHCLNTLGFCCFGVCDMQLSIKLRALCILGAFQLIPPHF